jgi:hypothetical protein
MRAPQSRIARARTFGIGLVLIAACGAALATNADAAHRHKPTAAAPTPTPTPVPTATPSLVIRGEGERIPGGAQDDRNGLFGFVSNSVRGGVRVAACRTNGNAALADLAAGSASQPACASTLAAAPPPVSAFAPTSGAASPSASAETTLDFAVDDVPLAATQNVPLGARGAFVQIPYLAHTVAIVYANPDVNGRLRLSVDELCRIASGTIADWDRIAIDPANPSGLHYPHRPLRFAYRRDASGETFALSNFLSATGDFGARRTCRRTGETFALGTVFDPQNTSVRLAPRFGVLPVPLPPGASRAQFLGADGPANELACVAGARGACRPATPSARANPNDALGTIGYATPADLTSAYAAGAPLKTATLYVVERGIPRDYDPIADLPGAATSLETYAVDRYLAPFVRNGRPPHDLVPADRPPAHPRCVAAIGPSAYAFPFVGYPIVAVTNLTFASQGNGERTTALRVLAGMTNESKNFTAKRIRSIDGDGVSTGTTGYSVLPLSTKKKDGVPALIRCIAR